MTLTASLNNSISGLNVAQARIAVVSDNVANVNTEGYVRKEAIQNTVTLSGQFCRRPDRGNPSYHG